MKTAYQFWIGLCYVGFSHTVSAQLLPRVAPEQAGISATRIERLHEGIQVFMDKGKHAGAVSVLARDGKLVDLQTYGFRNIESRAPMEHDTIVRIYSMSKVITSVAVLQLFEQGRLDLDNPVAQYIPEFKDLKVFTGGTVENPELADLERPMTIKHLLTHTAGTDVGQPPDISRSTASSR